jgi:EAL domain-containing protein (putative c-di-GMP-specific phosphodiesterase class I)/DNA-binding NarL/FixJ family response regulator
MGEGSSHHDRYKRRRAAAGRYRGDDRPRILVVDDDPGIRLLLRVALDAAGMDAVEAGTGPDALDLISTGPATFAAAVLDNRLPGLSGLEVLQAIRARRDGATLPVLLLTADGDLADRVAGLSLGATDYVAKPFDVREVVARVEAQLRQSRAWAGVLERHLREGAAIAGQEARVRARRRARVEQIIGDQLFWPVFQPLVRLADRAVVGYEALTRFRDGTPPDRGFAEAASAGMALDLEAATMAAALVAGRSLPGDAWICCNVSPALVLEGTVLRRLLGRGPRVVVLELTEHDPIEDYLAMTTALARLGPDVPLSIDDAGEGFASLRHVLALRPAFVKLDKSWIVGLHEDGSRQALVAGLSHFARATGCQLVAEGVEHPADLDAVAALGVHIGQGFLLGRPAPAPAAA